MEFQPALQRWFNASFESATPVQKATWPCIQSGEHVLATAPTGSGKTLSAFFVALDHFASGKFETGATRVLYISPLKALNNDIQRNLLTPIEELQHHGEFPALKVRVRSGDTSQSDRARMLRNPPDILITTPESLSLLLTTIRGRQSLNQVETVIVDEVHALVENRRGVQLATSLERLVDITGEFQRVFLSATVNPLKLVADYFGGYQHNGNKRAISLVNAPTDKQLDVQVCFPEAAREAAERGEKIWEPLADKFRDIIESNKATLIFANSRRLTEKITLKINDTPGQTLAYAHHGSLAREIRTEVEKRLKAGELAAIVATSTLELGIDVGHLDEVILVQSPPSIAATLQRIGRAGHQVGQTSRGKLFPTHAADFLEAAVLTKAIQESDLEPLKPVEGALDVLAQIIISITASETWALTDLFHLITRSTPYRDLPRKHFDLVIEMLAGRYAGARVRELKSRVNFDRINQTIHAKKGAVLAMYNSGGTIPDRGYYKLRHIDNGANIGELDEEFVWEASIGQTFTLGTQHWQIQRITHNDVFVRTAKPGGNPPPFWRSEVFNRSNHFSERLGEFLERCEDWLARGQDETLLSTLQDVHGFEASAGTELLDYLSRQRQAIGGELPHKNHLVLEHIHTGPGGYRGPDQQQQLVIHTFWGGALNRPFAYALADSWWQQYGERADIHADNDAIVIQVNGRLDPNSVLDLLNVENFDSHLRASLEDTGYFGARFRECAGRSLLITRQRFNQRLPLWMIRLQAKKLMAAVKSFTDFPILLETWRTCLQDEFDLPSLKAKLERLSSGDLKWTYTQTNTPSPFAANVTFDQINRYMYADDQPESADPSALSSDLFESVLANASLRPLLKTTVIAEFVAKRQRLVPGYQPDSPAEWQEWIKERILMPASEVPELVADDQLVWLTDHNKKWLTHLELASAISDNFATVKANPVWPRIQEQRDDLQMAKEILSFYGPLSLTEIEDLLPEVPEELLPTLIQGQLVDGIGETTYCDPQNYEQLLRFQRASQRVAVVTKPMTEWPVFLANWQNNKTLDRAIDQLRGYAAPIHCWLDDFWAARGIKVTDADLDELLAQPMQWLGVNNQSITLCYRDEVFLFDLKPIPETLTTLFRDSTARYSYQQLKDQSQDTSTEFNTNWWQSVWAGWLSADSVRPLRTASVKKFQLVERGAQHSTRRRFRGLAQGWPGNWQLNTPDDSESDPLTLVENNKEKARLLIERYGILTRELANRELPSFRWAGLFRALRLMELSGEIISGYFFTSFSGPQFASPQALALFQKLETSHDFWCNALDPLSPSGLGLDWQLPQRRANNYLSFVAGNLALTVDNLGKRLTFFLDPDDPDLSRSFTPLSFLLSHHQHLSLDTINAEPAAQSPYLQVLQAHFTLRKDHKGYEIIN